MGGVQRHRLRNELVCLVNPESKQLLHILVVLDPKRAVQQDGTLLAAVTPIARALGAAVALLRLWRQCKQERTRSAPKGHPRGSLAVRHVRERGVGFSPPDVLISRIC